MLNKWRRQTKRTFVAVTIFRTMSRWWGCDKSCIAFGLQKAYWLCSQCVDIPWEPPAYEEPEVTKPPMSHQTYIAPLTHLVTGDNKVHSDVLRSSSASFFDEPEYILPSVDIQEVPANQAWLDPPSYQSVTSSGHQTSQSFFQQIADEPIIDYPLDESESYGNYPDYEESPEETAQESQTSGR